MASADSWAVEPLPRVGSHRRHWTTVVLAATAVVLAVQGCAGLEQLVTDEQRLESEIARGRAQREGTMNLKWQSRSLGEIVGEYGPPRRILDIPGGGNPPGFVLVYGRDDDTGCLDTFAMVYGREPLVKMYQCR